MPVTNGEKKPRDFINKLFMLRGSLHVVTSVNLGDTNSMCFHAPVAARVNEWPAIIYNQSTIFATNR